MGPTQLMQMFNKKKIESLHTFCSIAINYNIINDNHTLSRYTIVILCMYVCMYGVMHGGSKNYDQPKMMSIYSRILFMSMLVDMFMCILIKHSISGRTL